MFMFLLSVPFFVVAIVGLVELDAVLAVGGVAVAVYFALHGRTLLRKFNRAQESR
jgi:hypothetical protein